MTQSFKNGDIVQLKSGGPKMTVDEVDGQYGKSRIACVWFAGARRERAFFSPETLISAPEAKQKE